MAGKVIPERAMPPLRAKFSPEMLEQVALDIEVAGFLVGALAAQSMNQDKLEQIRAIAAKRYDMPVLIDRLTVRYLEGIAPQFAEDFFLYSPGKDTVCRKLCNMLLSKEKALLSDEDVESILQVRMLEGFSFD